MMLNVNPVKIAEGRAAYANGATVQNVFEFVAQAYKAADEAHMAADQEISPFQKAETDTKSFVIGFLDGALAEFRRGSRATGGIKA